MSNVYGHSSWDNREMVGVRCLSELNICSEFVELDRNSVGKLIHFVSSPQNISCVLSVQSERTLMMFLCHCIPKCISDLISTLSNLNMNNFSHHDVIEYIIKWNLKTKQCWTVAKLLVQIFDFWFYHRVFDDKSKFCKGDTIEIVNRCTK